MDEELNFEGYQMFRRARKMMEERGGGVVLYVKDHLSVTREEKGKDDECESIWLRILDLDRKELYIGVCYRSPSVTSEEVECLLRNIHKYAKIKILIMGNFNYREINWENEYLDAEGREFLDTINDCFLTHYVKKPTIRKNILVLILTSEPCMVEAVHSMSPFNVQCSSSRL